MKIEYDRQSDTLTIILRQARVKESDELRPGVIADFGYDGGLVSLEILNASRYTDNPTALEYAIAEPAAAVQETPANSG